MKSAIHQSYERYMVKIEAELADCTDDEHRAVLDAIWQ